MKENTNSEIHTRKIEITFDKNNLMLPRESNLICKHNSTKGIRSISGCLTKFPKNYRMSETIS